MLSFQISGILYGVVVCWVMLLCCHFVNPVFFSHSLVCPIIRFGGMSFVSSLKHLRRPPADSSHRHGLLPFACFCSYANLIIYFRHPQAVEIFYALLPSTFFMLGLFVRVKYLLLGRPDTGGYMWRSFVLCVLFFTVSFVCALLCFVCLCRAMD